MDHLKSSLKELRGVLTELQTSVTTLKTQPRSSGDSFSDADKAELKALRRMRDRTMIVVSSMIEKLESALKE
ncbi:MAG: hypothetical protein JW812_03960 [Alphaproteobacteria bacterium]|nr:hypothetical protein [Alphaproteobacteria bacterium]MBN2779558.1 hypothetical protein [Alphaproteobacteria bacterium]